MVTGSGGLRSIYLSIYLFIYRFVSINRNWASVNKLVLHDVSIGQKTVRSCPFNRYFGLSAVGDVYSHSETTKHSRPNLNGTPTTTSTTDKTMVESHELHVRYVSTYSTKLNKAELS